MERGDARGRRADATNGGRAARSAAGVLFARAARGLVLAAVAGVLAVTANGCFGARKYPGPALCHDVTDCDDLSPCTLDSCTDGACEHAPAAGPATDDGNGCTKDSCSGIVELHTPKGGADNCGAKPTLQCNAAGECTGCNLAQDCGADSACRKWSCEAGTCKAISASPGTVCSTNGRCDGRGLCGTCGDGVQNGGETDVDCGGPCVGIQPQNGGCAAGKRCDVDGDCAAGTTCESGVCCGAACGGSTSP